MKHNKALGPILSRVRLILAVSVCSSTPTFAAAKAPCVVKSPLEEQRLLKAIDNICGDTWCEGDFRFVFQSVIADRESDSFTLNFLMTPYRDEETVVDDNTVTAVIKPSTAVACKVKGYSDIGNLVSKTGRLDWDVYESLSKCINALESRLSV
jgi:hypothetical protein